MRRRVALWALLAVVAASAAVLSFASLRDLAIMCGYHAALAPLFPLVVDAGAAAGCLSWLGWFSSDHGRGFARNLTWALLVASIAGNAVVHFLLADGLHPAWPLIVVVSAIPPAVLGAVVHLAVVVTSAASTHIGSRCSDDMGVHNVNAHGSALVLNENKSSPGDFYQSADLRGATNISAGPAGPAVDPVAELLAQGAGRRRIARTLDISEHQARRLLAERRNGASG